MKMNFVTAWVGNEFPIEYVIRLYNGIRRNYNYDFKFTVITDKPAAILECSEIAAATYYVDESYPGWWSKIAFFHPSFHLATFFDLDTIITGNIDAIGRGFAGEVKFAILQNFLQPPIRNPAILDPCQFGSAVMFKSPYSTVYRIIYDMYNAYPLATRAQYAKMGDQKFIEETIQTYDLPVRYLQDMVPTDNYFRSVKFPEQLRSVPVGNRVVCYHGSPRPHQDMENEIIKEHWK